MFRNSISSKWSCLVGVGLVLLVMTANVTEAQNAANPPRLVLNVKGPVARTLGLTFSHDSHRLYEGGFSKVVNVWDVGFNGPNAPPLATPLETLRWEISRADRGRIRVIEMSPVANLLAVAGTAARTAGEITLYDLDRNQVLTSLHHPELGHSKPVISLSFSPNGNSLVSVSTDSVCCLWARQADNTWTVRRVRAAGPNDSIDRQPALFISPREFLLTERVIANNDERWRLAVYGTDGLRKRSFPTEYGRQITSLARRPDGTRFAVAAENGAVEIYDAATQRLLRQFTVAGEAGAVALSNQGLLGISNNQGLTPTNIRKGNSEVIVYDLNADKVAGRFNVSQLENVHTLAFSPDGRWLATHDDERQQVLAFDLRDPNGLAQPAIRLRGRGKEITAVAVRNDPPDAPIRVGFSHDPDGGIRNLFTPTQADIQRFEEPLPSQDFIQPDTFAFGWKVRARSTGFDLTSQTLELIQPNGQLASTIVLDVPRMGQFQGAYCFLPGGQNAPGAIAIGTDTLANIFVYALYGRRLRYFRDHTGEIKALSVTPDGKYLVSGSKDQTMKLWSLEGLHTPSPFPRSSEWGCDFVVEGNTLRVRNVLKSGIAFARNLRDGDELTLFRHVKADGRAVEYRLPGEMLAQIIDCPLFDQPLIENRRGADLINGRPIMVGWEPLLTLFVDTRDQWTVFTPDGYYNASDAEGHRLFGWHLNQERGITPRFELAENLQKDFERPDVIKKVLEVGNVFDALTALNEARPVNEEPTQALATRIQATPEVKIQAPLQTQVIPPQQAQIPVQAQVKFPPGANPDAFELRVSGNGRTATDTRFDANTGTVTATVPNDSNLNHLEVEVREKDKPVTDAVQQRAELKVRGSQPEKPPHREIHYVGMACEEYEHHDKLQFTHEDVEAVQHRFMGKQNLELRIYEPGDGINVALLDSAATLENLSKQIAQVRERLGQRGTAAKDDLLVMFVAGHGVNVESNFYFIPTSVKGNDPETIKREGIPWIDVCRLVDKLECQVVWLLDACHSGAAIDSSKSMIREANRPSQRFVMASSQANVLSQESEAFALGQSPGHGAFTYALLVGLQGQSREFQQADRITADTLAQFVCEHVKYKLTGRTQQPCFVPTSSTPEDANPRPIELSLVPKTSE